MLSVLRLVKPQRLIISRASSSDFSVIDDEEKTAKTPAPIPKKSILDQESIFHSRSEFWQKYPPTTPSDSREAWLETLTEVKGDNTNEVIKLHPNIWSVRPRLDMIYQNLEWQRTYKTIDWEYVKDRYEMEYTRLRRPWPQKGQGRARHKTKTSPLWIQGGKAHGNKGPRSYFHMIDYSCRVWGLIHTLSAKYAQDDVKFVKNLDIPSSDPKFIEDLIDKRGWAISTLFVDKNDLFPENLTSATMNILHVNMMPAYGLNVHDMIKHKTLVLTKDAVEHIEEKLLFAQRRLDKFEKSQSATTEHKQELPFHNTFGSLS